MFFLLVLRTWVQANYFRGTRDKHKHNLGKKGLESCCLLEASKLKRILSLHHDIAFLYNGYNTDVCIFD